jgi:[acyl-carrier-protein] S-malonyltransferase
MMREAQEKMTSVLNQLKIQMPKFEILQNVEAEVSESIDELRHQLVLQISSPVRWTQSIRNFKVKGFNRAVECGPGKVLGGLIKKIDSDVRVLNINNADELKLAESELTQ